MAGIQCTFRLETQKFAVLLNKAMLNKEATAATMPFLSLLRDRWRSFGSRRDEGGCWMVVVVGEGGMMPGRSSGVVDPVVEGL